MKIRSKIKNTLLAGVAGLTLTACGGGGGGGVGVVIDNTRTAISSLSTALYGHHSGSGTVGSSAISTSMENLMSISSNYSPQNSDKEDAKLVVEFFNEWENFNSKLEGLKNGTVEDRREFDTYMNGTFGADAPNGLAGKTWRDAHKEIHGAYLLLAKHKTLITRYANGDKIYTDETAYKNFVNDSELKAYENLTDQEIDTRLRTKAETDNNLTKYNDNAIAEKNIAELDTIHTIVNSAVGSINSLQSSISSAISATQASVSRMVNYHDVDKSKNIITSVNSAIANFEKVLDDLAYTPGAGDPPGLTITQKLDYYKSDEFKNAYKSYLYLKDDVKPVLDKIKNAGTTQVELDSSEIDILATDGKDNYSNDLTNFVNPKITTLEQEYRDLKTVVVNKERTDVADPVSFQGEPVVTYTEWATVYQGGGNEQRTKTTTTPNSTRVITEKCTWQESTFDGGEPTIGAETCVVVSNVVTPGEPTVTTATETRAGDNPVQTTVALDPVVATTTEESAQYTEITYTDAADTTTETEEGSATTTTANRDVTVTTDHGNNTSTTVVTRYVDTTVTTPITTRVYRTRHYTDTVKKDTRTVTTTTTVNRITYLDQTFEDVNVNSTVVNGDWSTTQLSQSQRSENILQSETTADQVVTTSDSGTELSRVTASNAYSDNDSNLGTKTANLSTTVADHQTTEYNNSTGLDMINAADAYAKGWTGEGAVLGVIDTYQDKDHADFNGKYQWYKDYVRNDDTVELYGSQHSHGTHVAGIVAAEKNGTGTHGVAYNADLVGANVDYHGNGMINKGLAQQALHDFAKLKSPTANGGEEMNIIAVNMSFNQPNFFYDGNGSTVTQLADGTYNATEITTRILNNGYGDSQYWKVATDNDIILVNSAGNYGFDHAGDPGLWAVEEDANGNLILGGKMVIVGSWDGTGVAGNKAGHVCLNINTANNTCNDTHRLSDFYILAPGQAINSTIPGDGTATLSGTSMAAPHVTGAFGVLHQMWPYMAGDNLVKLVMNTADKNLTGYNVNIHGQGLLDLDEATKPQGAVGLATSGRVDHPTVSLNNTYYSTGTALPSSLSNLKIMVLDDYDRNYYMDLGSSFTVKDKRKFSDVQMLVDNKNTFLPHQQMYGTFTQGGQYDLAKNYNFGLYTGENGSGDYSVNVGKDFYINNKFKLKTSLGHMSEQETWLGNSSDGVLAVGDNNDTTSANIGVAYQLGNNVLTLDYSKGFTDVNTTNNSLIKSFSDIETESYRLAYEIHKDTHTTFGWSFSLPSHITSGTMDLEVAESVNLDGTINYTDINSNLAQSTKEKNIGFYYNKSGEEELDASFNFTAEYRMDKSGVANNDGVEVGMNFVKKFAGNCKFLWMKNPKCFDEDGNMKANLFGKSTDNATKHGLVYDLETDKFVPIKK
jgi:subtilisin family serine protease